MGVSDMTVEPTAIDGLLRITPKSITDDRGTVREFFRLSSYSERVSTAGQWAQVNLTWTKHGALRGLHGEAMTKLVAVAAGEAFGAYLDTRPGSRTFGTVVTLPLTVGVQVLVPPGVCNGFQAVSPDGCQYLYCFDQEWQPGMAGVAVNPLDPALGIDWPLPPILSEKDAAAPKLADVVLAR
jgi:dTDP-4-dehydrorhamnose 3,5-epimerase